MSPDLDEALVEKVALAIMHDLETYEMVLADPLTLRRLRATRIAKSAIRATLYSELRPIGRVSIAHDGFAGDIIGHYTTREGKRGVVVQQDGTRVVHVYGEKWIAP